MIMNYKYTWKEGFLYLVVDIFEFPPCEFNLNDKLRDSGVMNRHDTISAKCCRKNVCR